MTAREIFASKAASDKREGTVTLPVSFDDISVLMGLSMEDSVTREIAFIEENKKVVPQYTSLAKKLGKILTVLKEFREQEKIKQDLFARINVLQDRLDELS